jgi:hypothetical protein
MLVTIIFLSANIFYLTIHIVSMTKSIEQSSINQDYDLTSQVIYQSDEHTISDDHSYAYNIVSKLVM